MKLSAIFNETSKMLFFFFSDRAAQKGDNTGLGVERPDGLTEEDAQDEFQAFRKRMMLAYRFIPNPFVSMGVLFVCVLSYGGVELYNVFFFVVFFTFVTYLYKTTTKCF